MSASLRQREAKIVIENGCSLFLMTMPERWSNSPMRWNEVHQRNACCLITEHATGPALFRVAIRPAHRKPRHGQLPHRGRTNGAVCNSDPIVDLALAAIAAIVTRFA